jgi:DNA-binding MarR family transcriptional regulator
MTEDQLPAPSLLYAVKQVERAVRAHLDELLRPCRLTTPQYTALTVLARRDGMTSAELARHSFVTPQSMGDLVTALERLGAVSRQPYPDHRRRLRITLTEHGRALLTQVERRVAALEERMVGELDGTERAALRDYLNRCRTALTTGRRRFPG